MKVIVNGLAVEYADEGAGPVLLLLHGWKDTHRTFDALVPFLKDQFRIVRLDLPGFGGSDTPKEAWHVGDYALFIAAFMAKVGVVPLALVGHSLGGRIVLKGVGEGVLSAERIVLIASAGVARRKTLRNRFFYIVAKIGKLLMFIPPFSFWKARMRKKLYAAAGSDYLGAGELRQTFLNVIREDLSEAAQQISVPTLLVWGSADTETPVTDGERLKEMMPHATLEVIAGADHFVHKAQAERVAARMRGHLVSTL